MEGQTEEEDNEEMVSVPKHLKVGAADELKGGGDHQEQSHSDNMTRDTSSCHKTNGDGILRGRKKGGRERERQKERDKRRERKLLISPSKDPLHQNPSQLTLMKGSSG